MTSGEWSRLKDAYGWATEVPALLAKLSSRISAGLIVVAMLSGCATYRRSKVVAKVGGYTMVGSAPLAILGFIVAVQDDPFGGLSNPPADGATTEGTILLASGLIGWVLLATGTGLLIGGIVGMARAPAEIPAPAFTPPALQGRALDDCKKLRDGQRRAAEQIADERQRAKLLANIRVCDPAPGPSAPTVAPTVPAPSGAMQP